MGKVVLFADAGEVLEVCSVGAQGGGGFGSANVESQNYKADRTVCFFQFEERFSEKELAFWSCCGFTMSYC